MGLALLSPSSFNDTSGSFQVGAVKCLEKMLSGSLCNKALDCNCPNIGEGKSFADDLNKERGIVSRRVTLLLRSAEIKPLFYRFVEKRNVW